MKKANETLAAHIARASEWPSYVRARTGADPLDVDYTRDGGEIHLVYLSLSLPSGRGVSSAMLATLGGIIERAQSALPKGWSVTMLPETQIEGVPDFALPVVFNVPLERTAPLLRQILQKFRSAISLPSDEELYPHTPMLFGASTPAEAAWCAWNLDQVMRWRRTAVQDVEMSYLAAFLEQLAQQRVVVTHIANQLYVVGSELARHGIESWRGWRPAVRRDPPELARVLSPFQVIELTRRDDDGREEYLSLLLRAIYADKLAVIRQTLRRVKESDRGELHSFLVDQTVRGIALSRVVSDDALLGGDDRPGETVRVFDKNDEDL